MWLLRVEKQGVAWWPTGFWGFQFGCHYCLWSVSILLCSIANHFLKMDLLWPQVHPWARNWDPTSCKVAQKKGGGHGETDNLIWVLFKFNLVLLVIETLAFFKSVKPEDLNRNENLQCADCRAYDVAGKRKFSWVHIYFCLVSSH